jgi:hypothetical protein
MADELKKGDFYYAFALKEAYRNTSAPLLLRTFHQKLAEKDIIDKALVSAEVKKEVKSAYQENKNIQLRFVRRSTPIGCIIIKNRVIQLMWGERPTAIETTSSQIHRQYKEFFEELWEEAKE